MDPTEPRKCIPLSGEPGTPEERHLCQLSTGMTLEGNHLASTAPHTVAASGAEGDIWELPVAPFQVHLQPWGSPSPSQAPAPLSFLV